MDVTELTSLPSLVSTDRFETYLEAVGRDTDRALRLYCWNIEASGAWWGPFHVLEVAVRNSVHSRLVARTGRPDWWHSTGLSLKGDHPKRLREAVDRASRDHAGNSTAGHVVAQLSLGFWIGLLANRYHQHLWIPDLRQAFPHYNGRRDDLHQSLERLRKLRNRVAHHEPVFARDLGADHRMILDMLGYINPEAQTWVADHSRVPIVLAERQPTEQGLRETHF